ncbi:MAG: sensor histidine kinase [Aureispira sp.]
MNNILYKLQNLGIDENTSSGQVRRIRMVNRLSILALLSMTFCLIYSYYYDWIWIQLFVLLVFYPFMTAPLVLNQRGKIFLGKLVFIMYLYPTIFLFSAFFPQGSHFQYYTFVAMGLPLLIIDQEFGWYKWLFPILGLISWLFLEWWYFYYPPMLKVNTTFSYVVRVTNDFIILVANIIIYYTMLQDRDADVEKIKQKSLELEEKNTQLEHFAYIASHDLNEPLRTISSFIEIIKEEYEETLNDDLHTYFNFIQDALTRMRAMIDGLLRYSQIGKSADFQLVNINALLVELQEDLSNILEKNEVTLHIQPLPTINCLELELRQLFQNLITNAIKFQKPTVKPSISIVCEEQSTHWRFCILDNGIGVRAEKQEEIFNIFTKLHRSTEYQGQGIGLAFCKKIIAIHQGKIWVESVPGEGSQFYFTILKR